MFSGRSRTSSLMSGLFLDETGVAVRPYCAVMKGEKRRLTVSVNGSELPVPVRFSISFLSFYLVHTRNGVIHTEHEIKPAATLISLPVSPR